MSCGPIQDAAKNLAAEIAEAVEAVRKNNPMAGSITNTVTIDFVANAQLAVGGSAAMVYLPDEGEFSCSSGRSDLCEYGHHVSGIRTNTPCGWQDFSRAKEALGS